MSTMRVASRRTSGAIRHLPSGRWQARYTGPDGAMRTLGTFATKAEADQGLAQEVSRISRGEWRDPRLGEQLLSEWLHGWIATRTDIAESTRALYRQSVATWIDAPLPTTGRTGEPRTVYLGIRTLASITPALVREWHHAVMTESTRRETERWHAQTAHPKRAAAAIRAWAAEQGAPLAPAGRIPSWAREGWLAATGGSLPPARPLRRNAGQTAATRAYGGLHAGLAQAVADGLILANPCAIKGAGQRDARDRAERRIVTAEEVWALADAMPERYSAAVIVAFCSGLRAGELSAPAAQAHRPRRRNGPRRADARAALAGPGLVLRTQDRGRSAHRRAPAGGRRGPGRASGSVHAYRLRGARVRHSQRAAAAPPASSRSCQEAGHANEGIKQRRASRCARPCRCATDPEIAEGVQVGV